MNLTNTTVTRQTEKSDVNVIDTAGTEKPEKADAIMTDASGTEKTYTVHVHHSYHVIAQVLYSCKTTLHDWWFNTTLLSANRRRTRTKTMITKTNNAQKRTMYRDKGCPRPQWTNRTKTFTKELQARLV